jgi:hypothetical protein
VVFQFKTAIGLDVQVSLGHKDFLSKPTAIYPSIYSTNSTTIHNYPCIDHAIATHVSRKGRGLKYTQVTTEIASNCGGLMWCTCGGEAVRRIRPPQGDWPLLDSVCGGGGRGWGASHE